MVKKTRRGKQKTSKVIDLDASQVEEVVEAASEDAKALENEALESHAQEAANVDSEQSQAAEADENLQEAVEEHAEPVDEPVEEIAPAPAAKKGSAVTMAGMLGSAILGGGIALGGAGALNQAGILQHVPFASGLIYAGGEKEGASPDGDLTSEIAALKQQVQKLSTAKPAAGGKVQVPNKIINRISALEISLKSMNANVSKALKSGAGNSEGSATVSAELNGKIDAANKAAQTASSNASDALAKVSELSQKVIAGSGGADEATIKAALASETKALETKITALEASLANVSAKFGTQTAAVDPKLAEDLSGLKAQVGDLSSKLAGIGEQVSRIDELEAQSTKLAAQTESVNKRIETDIMAPMADVKAAASAALVSQKIAKTTSIRALSSAIENGRSFSFELAEAEGLIGKGAIFDELAVFAQTGVKTAKQLSSDFSPLYDGIIATQNAPSKDAGILSKFLSNAKSIVTVRPAGSQEGDDAVSIASRIADNLSKGDLEQSEAEWKKLPADAKEQTAGWAKQLQDNLVARGLISKMVEAFTSESEG